MALDLEEQEQVAELRAWWNRHGGLVILVIAAAALAFSGWQGWRWYGQSRAAEASALYDQLGKAASAGDAKALRDAGGALAENHAGSAYAAMGALRVARFYFDRGDTRNARAQLQWILDRQEKGDFRDLAVLRFAAVLLDEKDLDGALKMLDSPHGAAFDSQFAALRGDVLAAKQQPAEAKAAYRLAIDKTSVGDEAFAASVRMRLDALGG